MIIKTGACQRTIIIMVCTDVVDMVLKPFNDITRRDVIPIQIYQVVSKNFIVV